ncbi:GroES-like protein [Vararia minispora EC-137]|uniref:GroES-like protein n=1 Tax=Vararia minispora EC-137 TaxID=1314806 RepID=A0ACB8QN93_9AGAM|nr:GroES-like protein [Vararia minispora EC-137]
MSPMHKALVLHSKDAGKFVIEDRPTPTPGPGQLLIKIYATALNPVDLYVQSSGYIVDAYGFPAVPGCDGAGVVEALGEGVKGWAQGDRVLMQGHWVADRGTLQQYAISDAVRTTKIPDDMSFEEASTIPLALATSAVGLYHTISESGLDGPMGGIELTPPWEGGTGKYAGQPILILGGSSSVGQLAIQLAKLSGFSPIITTASKHNEAYCKAAGATHVIDYKDVPYADLPAAVTKITTEPFKVVYDAVTVDDSQTAGWTILAPGGDMVVTLPPKVGQRERSEANDGKRVAFTYGSIHLPMNAEFGARMHKALPGLLKDGAIKPNRVEVCGSDLSGAFAGLERLAGGVSGVKLVVRPHGI